MSTKKQQQQPQPHELPMVVAGMAAATAASCPVRTKLLLFAALGFALGVAATASLLLVGSDPSSSSYTAASLRELLLPASAATTNAVQDRQQPHGAPRPPSPPEVGMAGINSSAAVPPPPPTPTGGGGASRGGGGSGSGISSVTDDDDDEALMALAATAPRVVPAGATPKVAFLFLTRWDLPMAPLWDEFFAGHRGRYSVYVHTDPAFNGSEPAETSAFHRRRIPSKVRASSFNSTTNQLHVRPASAFFSQGALLAQLPRLIAPNHFVERMHSSAITLHVN